MTDLGGNRLSEAILESWRPRVRLASGNVHFPEIFSPPNRDLQIRALLPIDKFRKQFFYSEDHYFVDS